MHQEINTNASKKTWKETSKGRKEGTRQERKRKQGRKEGRKGRKEGRASGRKEGRKVGRQVGRNEAKVTVLSRPEPITAECPDALTHPSAPQAIADGADQDPPRNQHQFFRDHRGRPRQQPAQATERAEQDRPKFFKVCHKRNKSDELWSRRFEPVVSGKRKGWTQVRCLHLADVQTLLQF